MSFKTAELEKEIIHCKMSPVNGANLERGSHREYLTGCSEVFRKSLDWKKGETDLQQASSFTDYLALGKPIKGYDDNYPVYFTGKL